MNPYANEDVMWQRLKDIQREAENSRLLAERALPTVGRLLERVWLLAGLATRRPPRRSALRVVDPERVRPPKVA